MVSDDEVTPSGLMWSPCPDCGGREGGCDVCEGTGRVLVPLENVRTDSPTVTSEVEVHASQDASSTEGDPKEGAAQERDASQLFGGKGPAEAARLRWEKERARQAEQEAVETGSDVIVRTTVPVPRCWVGIL